MQRANSSLAANRVRGLFARKSLGMLFKLCPGRNGELRRTFKWSGCGRGISLCQIVDVCRIDPRWLILSSPRLSELLPSRARFPRLLMRLSNPPTSDKDLRT